MALNFNEAIAGLPQYDAYEGLEEEEKQLIARRFVERLVEQTEKPGNGPDDYERLHLGKAVMVVKTPLFGSAFAYAHTACKSPADRIYVQESGIIEVPNDLTLRELLKLNA